MKKLIASISISFILGVTLLVAGVEGRTLLDPFFVVGLGGGCLWLSGFFTMWLMGGVEL